MWGHVTSLFSLHLPSGQNTNTYCSSFHLRQHMPLLHFQLWLFYSLKGLQSATPLLRFRYVAVLSFRGNQFHIVLFLYSLTRFRKEKRNPFKLRGPSLIALPKSSPLPPKEKEKKKEKKRKLYYLNSLLEKDMRQWNIQIPTV